MIFQSVLPPLKCLFADEILNAWLPLVTKIHVHACKYYLDLLSNWSVLNGHAIQQNYVKVWL